MTGQGTEAEVAGVIKQQLTAEEYEEKERVNDGDSRERTEKCKGPQSWTARVRVGPFIQ